MIAKDRIIAEIQRTAAENGGKPLGRRRFENETGIRESDWLGKHWARWGDALVESGFQPNTLQDSSTEEEILDAVGTFAVELGRFPTGSEIQIRAKNDPRFPMKEPRRRFGGMRTLAERLLERARSSGDEQLASICEEYLDRTPQKSTPTKSDAPTDSSSTPGHVYLIKSGRYYKIGRTNSVGRRQRELDIQLPERAEVIHSIATDDPAGIESYWHRRFDDRRKNGEWFELTAADVRAFKRRRAFM